MFSNSNLILPKGTRTKSVCNFIRTRRYIRCSLTWDFFDAFIEYTATVTSDDLPFRFGRRSRRMLSDKQNSRSLNPGSRELFHSSHHAGIHIIVLRWNFKGLHVSHQTLSVYQSSLSSISLPLKHHLAPCVLPSTSSASQETWDREAKIQVHNECVHKFSISLPWASPLNKVPVSPNKWGPYGEYRTLN